MHLQFTPSPRWVEFPGDVGKLGPVSHPPHAWCVKGLLCCAFPLTFKITSSPLSPNRRFNSNTGPQMERQVNPPLEDKQPLHECWSHEVEENKCSCDKSFLQCIEASGEAIMTSDIWKTGGKYEMFASFMITLQLLWIRKLCSSVYTDFSSLAQRTWGCVHGQKLSLVNALPHEPHTTL